MQRQITIKGTHSDWYDQATFILKSQHTQAPPENLISFADELVENYLKKSSPTIAYTPPILSSTSRPLHKVKSQTDKYIDYLLYLSLTFLFIVILLCFCS